MEAAEAWIREANRLQRENRPAEAMAVYERLLLRHPELADCWYNLALLQRRARRLDEALDSYRKALDAGISRPEEVHLNRGVIFTDHLGQHAAAEAELQAALSINPCYTPALLNLGTLFEDLGRREDALQAYHRILAIDSDDAEALARIANLQPRGTVEPSLIQRLKSALARRPGPAAAASLGFALGRLLDAAGDYTEAFAAYRAANDASRSSAVEPAIYDRARQHELVDRLIAAGRPTAISTRSPPAGPVPLFICGMFRSGSTLTEQMLSAVPGVAAGGERDFLPDLVERELAPYPESLGALTAERLDAIAERYCTELARAGAGLVIDKRPDNFLHIGLIKSMFPAARIVHTIRDPIDNCLSIFFLHLDQHLSYALDLMDIGHYYREYRRLMAHWKRLYPGDIIDFDYDALVGDPAPAFAALCAALGLRWTGGLPPGVPPARAIKTASVWQVREPLYSTSSGRARHYRAESAALRAYLAEHELAGHEPE